jgi:hypothetical protein
MTGAAGPVTHVTALLQAVDAQLRQRTPEMPARARYPHLAYASIDTLLRDPFFTIVFRDPDYSVVRFPTGTIASCLTPNLDRARAQFLSPTQPDRDSPPRRRATPRYVPESPPREPDDRLHHNDVTYDLSALSALQSSSVSVPPGPPRPTKPRSPPPPSNLRSQAPASPPECRNAPLYASATVAPAPWQAFVGKKNPL